MRFWVSKTAFVIGLIAAVLLPAASAGAQTIPPSVRERAERLKPVIEWVESERKSASIAGDVALALDIGLGEEVATIAKIHRDATGLQYSFHIVRDHPEFLVLIRSNSEVSDSWKVFRTGFIDRSVHVDEQDKINVSAFQPRLFDETLRFFESSVRAVNNAAPAAPNAPAAAASPAEPPPAMTSLPWLRPPAAPMAPADSFAALISRGTEYNLNSDYARAMADFNEAIRLNSNSAAGYYGRAAVYYNMGDYDRALQDYDRVLQIEPKNAMASMFRALTDEKKTQR